MEDNGKLDRYKQRLKQRDFKLKTLLETTKAINDNQSIDDLLSRYRSTVEHDLQIRRLVLFMRIGSSWSCAISYGINKDYSAVDAGDFFSDMSEISLLQGNNNPVFEEFDLLIPVSHQEKPICYLLVGDIDDDEIRMSPVIKHMRFIQTLTNIIAVAIENKALFQKSLEQERIDTELQLAAEMQSLLVGSGTKDYLNFEVVTHYQPHQAIGGDFCDFIPLSDEEAFFCMADVSGKGVSAAFLMATIQAHMRALIEHTNWTLESLVKQLNQKVNETVRGDRFVTVFLGYFHLPSRSLQYINAGHNPPFVISGGKATFLESGSVGIGMLEELPFINKGEIELDPDALLVMYTDGVVELENEAGEEFGHEQLCELISEKQSLFDKIDDAVVHIVHAMDVHRGSMPYFDDTALLCCRFK